MEAVILHLSKFSLIVVFFCSINELDFLHGVYFILFMIMVFKFDSEKMIHLLKYTVFVLSSLYVY